VSFGFASAHRITAQGRVATFSQFLVVSDSLLQDWQ